MLISYETFFWSSSCDIGVRKELYRCSYIEHAEYEVNVNQMQIPYHIHHFAAYSHHALLVV